MNDEVDNEVKPWLKFATCPHCNEKIVINASLDFTATTEVWPSKKPTPVNVEREDSFHPHERKLLDEARDNGILEAFTEAMNAQNPHGELKDKTVERAFIVFLKLASPKRVPAFVIEAFNQEFPGRLWFAAANGVVSVSSDGKLRAFFPQKLAVGTKIGKLGKAGGSIASRMPADEEGFEQWIRTKHGYVVGKGLFFDSMQRRSKGEFVDVIL